MAEHDPQHDPQKKGAGWQPDNALERELDAALSNYTAVEPRAGLEQRVLANLRAEPQKGRPWEFSRWCRVAILAAATIVAVWAVASKLGRPGPDNTAQRRSTTTLAGQPGAQVVSNGEENAVQPHRAIVIRRSSVRSAHLLHVVAAEPKLEQFPSPRPLSDQEKILASYIQRYPEHAWLIAQARAEGLRRDAAEQLEIGQGGGQSSSGSDR